MTHSFNPERIDFDVKVFSIFETLRKIESGAIKLNPEFQRNFVWDEQTQSRLIESILLHLPLPAFYIDSTEEHWQVIDGLQRLTTLRAFLNQQTLVLNGLEILRELNGKHFSELPKDLRERLEDTQIHVILLKPGTPRNVKFLIFQRINTGGLTLTDQEIRHAIHSDQARDLLRDLAAAPEVRALLEGKADVRRMEDRECVLRFFALRLTPPSTFAEPDAPLLSAVLDQTMAEEIGFWSAAQVEQSSALLIESMQKASLLFGGDAFLETQDFEQDPGPFNKRLFDAWSVALSRYDTEQLAQQREHIRNGYTGLLSNDTRFRAAIADDRPDQIAYRFSAVERLLAELFGR